MAQTDTTTFGAADYERVVGAVISAYDATAEGSARTDFAACTLRLAGHDLMDYQAGDATKLGGSDGCIRFSDPVNGGLLSCLQASPLVAVYQSVCTKVSLADFIVIAGEAVMGRTSPSYNPAAPYADGTLLNRFKHNFTVGRTTVSECPWAEGRLPDPEKSCDVLESVLVKRIFNDGADDIEHAWRLTAAISGAHTLGRAS